MTTHPIVAQARTWLRTPFHHQARLKGKGCDCLGLIIGVVDELQLEDDSGRLLSSYDEINYSKMPDGARLLAKLELLLDEVPKEQAQPGDLGLFVISNNPQHLAIFSDYEGTLGMIHCFADARRVVEHRLDEIWKSRLIKVYRWQP